MASGDSKRNLAELLRAGGYEDEGTAPYSSNLAEASKNVQRRIRALKKNQLESIHLESEFYARVHQLEKEFQPLFDAVYEKRKAIVNGEHEPTDDECQLPLVHGLSQEELQKLEENAPVEGVPSKGVPGFWYYVLSNTTQISDMIFEYDTAILKHLIDITTEVHSSPPGFTLFFHFEPNPYFTNTVLKKYYELQLTPDDDEPFDYDGPTVVKSRGDKIDWKEGKNVTEKTVKKKQKKGISAGQFITKVVQNDSFFNFFDAAEKKFDETEDEDDDQSNIRNDFEVGQLIRDQIIPRAVLFYTGEAADDEDFFDEDDGEDGLSDDAGDDDDE